MTSDTQIWEIVLSADIGNMECAMLAHPLNLRLININLRAGIRYRYGTEMSPWSHGGSFPESQHYIINPTNPSSALDDGIEHRLDVRRRAADDA